MQNGCDLIVYSDLDGTLIDHQSYSWEEASEAVSALKLISAGLVLASSKTAAEISVLRVELGTQDWPAIVENGAGILPANVSEIEDSGEYALLLKALNEVSDDLRHHFTGFNDVSCEEVAQMTGLSNEAAICAKDRRFSEPGTWSGTKQQKAEFLRALGYLGVKAIEGGRFLTLSFGKNKVDQLRQLNQLYAPKTTVALGDAPNDVAMLEAVDFGVVIANPNRPPLPPLNGEAEGRISRTTKAGPLGWNEAILDLIEHLNLR